jgi:hypothetical protein
MRENREWRAEFNLPEGEEVILKLRRYDGADYYRKKFSQITSHARIKDMASIFRYPHNMILGAICTVPIPLLGKLAEAVIVKMNEREAELVLANLKVRMEA